MVRMSTQMMKSVSKMCKNITSTKWFTDSMIIDSIDHVTGIGNGTFNVSHPCCAGSIQAYNRLLCMERARATRGCCAHYMKMSILLLRNSDVIMNTGQASP